MKRKPVKQRKPVFLWVIYFLLTSSGLFAFGKKEAEEIKALNNEWLLCVTGFDIAALPETKRPIGEVFNRSLVDTFKTVSYRLRISPEYAYYESYAWTQSRSGAAKALSAKQDERAFLLYRGDANWKYKQDLKKIDADIVKLQEDLAKIEAEMPLINAEPVFDIIQPNKDGTFPPPPQEGRERRFCMEQGADAFLAGAIREYHNRYYVTLRLYALYTNAFVYDDEIIFSADDINGAVDEIAGRLTAVLAGTRPAAVAVRARPADTLVLINRAFAGRGTVESHDRPPGTISVDLSAPDHAPETVEVELFPGELANIRVNLLPQEFTEVQILAAGAVGGAVYQGSMYVGEAPLTLRLPVNQYNYFSVELPGGQLAKAAFVSPGEASQPYVFSLKPKTLHPSSEQRVDKARKAYYWAWGGTWITGIAAWLVNGMVRSQVDGLNQMGSFSGDWDGVQKFYDDTLRLRDISTGFWAAVGVAAAVEIFQMARYIYIATEDVTPIAKPDK
jgi:hypothetical protein